MGLGLGLGLVGCGLGLGLGLVGCGLGLGLGLVGCGLGLGLGLVGLWPSLTSLAPTRLNLAPMLVVEQRLSSRKPFPRAAQMLLEILGEAYPVSANQCQTTDDIFVLDSWKRSWRENYAWWECANAF